MKRKFDDDFAMAEVINQAYKVKSTFDPNRRYSYIFYFDDDITALLESKKVYEKVLDRNPEAKVVMVGGEGLLATAYKVMRVALKVRGKKKLLSKLRKETEAQRLARVAIALGIPEEKIIILDSGTNTTENLQEMSWLAKQQPSLVISTQRLGMIFKQSAGYQCNSHPATFGMTRFVYDIYCVEQTAEETARWYNFQAAGNRRVALHGFAALSKRFDVYHNKFLTRPFEPEFEVKEAADYLAKRFLIKQRLTGFKGIFAKLQYIPIIWDIFWNAEKHIEDEEKAIKRHKF
ncbi:MAG: YdcF family protein [Alphaproteobacteria bacterium]|nr:YdcF family protein [Alphaproteobacteria bacterium]